MKYCLSGRQPDSVLRKADEIKVELRDYRALPDYIDKFADKTIILDFNKELPDDFDWEILKVYSDKMNGKFICAIANMNQVAVCKELGLNFYYRFTATHLYEVEALAEMGVSYILIGVPLIFNLKRVSAFKIPLRAIPNLAYEPYLFHKDGVCGGWVRPEDVKHYEQYISTFEFYAPKMLEKESTLYHIYAENGKWPGDLNLLIDNLNYHFNNSLLYDEDNFALRRMNCQQRCLERGTCHYCHDQLAFAEVVKKYHREKHSLT